MNSPQPIVLASARESHEAAPNQFGRGTREYRRRPQQQQRGGGRKPVIRGLTNNRVLVLDNGSGWNTTSGATITSPVSSRPHRPGSRLSAVPQACCTDRMRSGA